MSRFRLSAKLRQNDYWKPLMVFLESNGVSDWTVEDGKPHPALVFSRGGRQVRYTLPISPCSRSKTYVVTNLRRRLREVDAMKVALAGRDTTAE